MRSAGGIRSTCDSQSRTTRRACSHGLPVVVLQLSHHAWRILLDQRRRESGREERQGLVRHPDEPRSQERRGTKVRRRIREETNERRDVLDLVGVEEPEAFVDVGRDAQRLELVFELPMTRARSKENRDVARSHLSGDPRLLVAYRTRRRRSRRISCATSVAQTSGSSAAAIPSAGLVAESNPASTGNRSPSP